MPATFVHAHRMPYDVEFNITLAEKMEPGDALWWNGTTLQKASEFTWDTSEVLTRQKFAAQFAGIANFHTDGREQFDMTVAVPQDGIFEFGLTSATPKIGDLLGLEKASGNTLLDDKLQIVLDPSEAIGYCVKDYSAATTKVRCRLFSRFTSEGGLMSRVKHLVLYVEDETSGGFISNVDIITDYTFNDYVKILSIESIVSKVVASAAVFTLEHGTDNLDETHTIIDTAIIGVVTRTLMVGASNPDRLLFEPDTLFSIKNAGAATAGAATITVNYMSLPFHE